MSWLKPRHVAPVEPSADVPNEGMPLMPPQGFSLEAFPRVSVQFINYVAQPLLRPDPAITINQSGEMWLDVGNVRFTVHSREEWAKLVDMGERVWNSHEQSQESVDE